MSRTLKILSAGAVKGGVAKIAAEFERTTGQKVEAEFTQVPKLRKRIAEGEHVDVVVATAAALDEFATAGKIIPGTRALLGRSRVGVLVHKDAPAPDVSDTEAFKRALLDAKAVVHNDASSGIYIASLLEKLRLKAQLGERIVVVNSGAAINTAVAERGAGAIGMGQISEIMVMIAKGCPVKLVAPLPDAIQNDGIDKHYRESREVLADLIGAELHERCVRFPPDPADIEWEDAAFEKKFRHQLLDLPAPDGVMVAMLARFLDLEIDHEIEEIDGVIKRDGLKVCCPTPRHEATFHFLWRDLLHHLESRSLEMNAEFKRKDKHRCVESLRKRALLVQTADTGTLN